MEILNTFQEERRRSHEKFTSYESSYPISGNLLYPDPGHFTTLIGY
jgi:hypothetical protein